MSSDALPVPSAVDELRRAFDGAFAAPAGACGVESEDVLAVRIAGDPYGVKIRDLAGVVQAGRVVPLPGSLPHLLGIVRVRGTVVPLYSLAVLLGYAEASRPSRWLVLCGKVDPFGLDIGEIEACLRVPRSDLCASDGTPCSGATGGASRSHVLEVVRTGADVRPIIDLASVARSIHGGTRRRAPA